MAELLVPSHQSSSPSLALEQERFRREGHLLIENVVDRASLAELSLRITAQWQRDVETGNLFTGGGNVSGHLNCFPGAASRFVYEALRARGIFELVQAFSSERLLQPNVGCNLNLPGSSAQNEHVDGYVATPFLVVNVAAVDTDLTNGAMEIIAHSHLRSFKYWEIALQRGERRRVLMKQGDVLVRTSTLWHRGMANHSSAPRPMLAFTWENAGSPLGDPYSVHGGRIKFLPNRYKTNWQGRLIERAFVAAPRLGTAYRVARSFFE